MLWTRIFDILRRSPPEPRKPLDMEDVKGLILPYTYGCYPDRANEHLAEAQARLLWERLPSQCDAHLEIFRFVLSYQGSLTEVVDTDLSDRDLREYFASLEAKLTSLMTGEPPRRLPWEQQGPFRGGR